MKRLDKIVTGALGILVIGMVLFELSMSLAILQAKGVGQTVSAGVPDRADHR